MSKGVKIKTSPVVGVMPPNVTDEERVACIESMLNGTDAAVSMAVIMPCGQAMFVCGRRLPTGRLLQPEEGASMLQAVLDGMAKQIATHDCNSHGGRYDAVIVVDNDGNSTETPSAEYAAATKKKAH